VGSADGRAAEVCGLQMRLVRIITLDHYSCETPATQHPFQIQKMEAADPGKDLDQDRPLPMLSRPVRPLVARFSSKTLDPRSVCVGQSHRYETHRCFCLPVSGQ
jgi:hypothetical protein